MLALIFYIPKLPQRAWFKPTFSITHSYGHLYRWGRCCLHYKFIPSHRRYPFIIKIPAVMDQTGQLSPQVSSQL